VFCFDAFSSREPVSTSLENAPGSQGRPVVPTLFRFLAFLALLAGIVFGGMVALVTFVEPEPREMIEIVPPAKLQPR